MTDKRTRALALLFVCLLASNWSCSSQRSLLPPSEGALRLELLRVGTSGDYPPFSQAGSGFDIDVANLLAKDLGIPIEWVPFRWPELQSDVERDRFDVAMSGVTWRPSRSVVGSMSRAYGIGGPCLVADRAPADGTFARVAVNRGGILERWARAELAHSDVVTTDDNLSLPQLLRGGKVDAFVTDSFEVAHFRADGQFVQCEAATDRKSYWIAPRQADHLGPYLERWLVDNEDRLRKLRQRHFGAPLPRSDLDHLVDMVARRLEFMPEVAAWKIANNRAIEDLEQERRVLASATRAARRHGLSESRVLELFRVQIDLAKAIQRRTSAERTTELDLDSQIRPQLIELGDRILSAMATLESRGGKPTPEDRIERAFDPLTGLLLPEEIQRLRSVLVTAPVGSTR